MKKTLFFACLALALPISRISAHATPDMSLEFDGSDSWLVIVDATGCLCQIQWVDELAPTNNWLWLTSLAITSSPCRITDSGSASADCRCYRAVVVTPNAVLVPGGSFAMGDAFNELGADELPVHTATVSAFAMDRTEVPKALWDIVYSWATNNGYGFGATSGRGRAPSHPVQVISWYDAVKWCNARSELEGLTPCYYTNEIQSGVYRAGQITLSNSFVNWSANGYRLPTEAEWEWAARGGAAGMRFPWSDTNVISHTRANYFAGTYYSYDKSPTLGYHPAFTNGPSPYTSPGGYFAPNGFGLFDMAGNVWEWCWDWHDPNWYTNAAAILPDTRGPGSGSKRVGRGGSYSSNAPDNCCALREGVTPTSISTDRGFRCVRKPSVGLTP